MALKDITGACTECSCLRDVNEYNKDQGTECDVSEPTPYGLNPLQIKRYSEVTRMMEEEFLRIDALKEAYINITDKSTLMHLRSFMINCGKDCESARSGLFYLIRTSGNNKNLIE